jgi:hypothetical protein
MLTDIDLGIEYQGSRYKGTVLGKQHMILVSGDVTIHSAMLLQLAPTLAASQAITTLEMAELCAGFMREYRMKEAARLFLSPLNLDEKSFLAQQRTMEPSLVIELANQLQGHKIEAEALVLGCEGKQAHLYRVDRSGVVTCHDDIGFVSIGNGGVHASAQFMLESYTHAIGYYRALYQTFAAKKWAEVAPGVGNFTDMFFITRDGVTQVAPAVIAVLDEIFAKNLERVKKFSEEAESQLIQAEQKLFPQPSTPPVQLPPPEATTRQTAVASIRSTDG